MLGYSDTIMKVDNYESHLLKDITQIALVFLRTLFKLSSKKHSNKLACMLAWLIQS